MPNPYQRSAELEWGEQEPIVTTFSEAQATQIAKALSDPIRLQAYTEIARRQQLYVGELQVCNMVSRATVSHHLRILTEAGLVSSVRNGQYVIYRAIPERLVEYRLYLSVMIHPTVVSGNKRSRATQSERE